MATVTTESPAPARMPSSGMIHSRRLSPCVIRNACLRAELPRVSRGESRRRRGYRGTESAPALFAPVSDGPPRCRPRTHVTEPVPGALDVREHLIEPDRIQTPREEDEVLGAEILRSEHVLARQSMRAQVKASNQVDANRTGAGWGSGTRSRGTPGVQYGTPMYRSLLHIDVTGAARRQSPIASMRICIWV